MDPEKCELIKKVFLKLFPTYSFDLYFFFIGAKAAGKMLVKSATDVFFTNILQAVLCAKSILNSFSLLTVWLFNVFVERKMLQKLHIKCWLNWLRVSLLTERMDCSKGNATGVAWETCRNPTWADLIQTHTHTLKERERGREIEE